MAAEDEQVMKETNPAGVALQVTSPATGTSGGVNWGQADSFIASLCCASQMCFLQTEGITLHQQKDYDSFYCDTVFIAGVWNRTHIISKVFLYCQRE